jgi:hypothetical protein
MKIQLKNLITFGFEGGGASATNELFREVNQTSLTPKNISYQVIYLKKLKKSWRAG